MEIDCSRDCINLINEIEKYLGRKLTNQEIICVEHSYLKGFINGRTYELNKTIDSEF